MVAAEKGMQVVAGSPVVMKIPVTMVSIIDAPKKITKPLRYFANLVSKRISIVVASFSRGVSP